MERGLLTCKERNSSKPSLSLRLKDSSFFCSGVHCSDLQNCNRIIKIAISNFENETDIDVTSNKVLNETDIDVV